MNLVIWQMSGKRPTTPPSPPLLQTPECILVEQWISRNIDPRLRTECLYNQHEKSFNLLFIQENHYYSVVFSEDQYSTGDWMAVIHSAVENFRRLFQKLD